MDRVLRILIKDSLAMPVCNSAHGIGPMYLLFSCLTGALASEACHQDLAARPQHARLVKRRAAQWQHTHESLQGTSQACCCGAGARTWVNSPSR